MVSRGARVGLSGEGCQETARRLLLGLGGSVTTLPSKSVSLSPLPAPKGVEVGVQTLEE